MAFENLRRALVGEPQAKKPARDASAFSGLRAALLESPTSAPSPAPVNQQPRKRKSILDFDPVALRDKAYQDYRSGERDMTPAAIEVTSPAVSPAEAAPTEGSMPLRAGDLRAMERDAAPAPVTSGPSLFGMTTQDLQEYNRQAATPPTAGTRPASVEQGQALTQAAGQSPPSPMGAGDLRMAERRSAAKAALGLGEETNPFLNQPMGELIGRSMDPEYTRSIGTGGTLPTPTTRNITAGFGDVLAGLSSASRLAGYDKMADALARDAQGLQAVAQGFEGPELKNVQTAGALADYVKTRGARAMAFPIAMVPPAVIGGAAGVGVAGAMGLGAVGTTAAAAVGGALASRPLESAIEAGGVYEESLRQGATEEQAKKAARGVFWKNMALVVTDASELFTALAPLPAPLKKILGAVDAGNVAKLLFGAAKVLGTAAQEAGEEGLQDIIQRQAFGDQVAFDDQMQEAMFLGGLMGGGMAAGGATVNLPANQEGQPQNIPAPARVADAEAGLGTPAVLPPSPEGQAVSGPVGAVGDVSDVDRRISDFGGNVHQAIAHSEEQLKRLRSDQSASWVIRSEEEILSALRTHAEEAKAGGDNGSVPQERDSVAPTAPIVPETPLSGAQTGQPVAPAPDRETGGAQPPGTVRQERWQMTRREYMGRYVAQYGEEGNSGKVHRFAVEKALKEGKPVSPEVLKDYPELQPQTPAAPVVEPGQAAPESPWKEKAPATQTPAPSAPVAPSPPPQAPLQPARTNEYAGRTFKHFTTLEGKAALESGADFDFGVNPQHGTGDMGDGPKTGRFAGDRLYLSLEDSRWGKVTRQDPNGPVVEAKSTDTDKGIPFYDYDTQKWMRRLGDIREEALQPVEFKLADDAKVLVIDSKEALNRAAHEASVIAKRKVYVEGGKDTFWSILAQRYDAVALKNVGKVAKSTDDKFFKAAGGDQLIVLNQAKAQVVKPVPTEAPVSSPARDAARPVADSQAAASRGGSPVQGDRGGDRAAGPRGSVAGSEAALERGDSGTQAMAARPQSPGRADTASEPMKPMQRKALMEYLQEKFKVVISKGNFRERALGIYKVKPEVIRTRAWGDLEVLAHEIGHHLDKQLKLDRLGHESELLKLGAPTSKDSYTKAQKRAEGVAEFLRLYLSNSSEAKAEAGGFYAAFEKRIAEEPGLSAVIADAQKQIMAQFNAIPRDEIDAAVSWNHKRKSLKERFGTPSEALVRAKNWIVDEWFDSNAAVKRMQKELAGNKQLPADMDAYLRLNLLPKMIPGRVETRLREWQEMIAPLGDRVEDYLRYADAREVLWRSRRFGYGNDKLPFSIEAAEAYVEANDSPVFRQMFDAEQKMFSQGLRELRNAGVLSDQSVKQIEDAYTDKDGNLQYIPFYRDIDARNRRMTGAGRSTVNLSKGVARQRGGGEPLLDPVERRIRYFSRMIGIAERNKVGEALARLSESFEGAGQLMDEIPPPQEHVKATVGKLLDDLEKAGADVSDVDPSATVDFFRPAWAKGKDDTIITVWRNGEAHFYDMHDAGVLRAVTAMDPITTNVIANLAQSLSSVYRTGATITPSFTLANLIRDTAEAFILSKHQVVPGQAFFESLRLLYNKDPFVQKVIDNGLKQGGWLRPERVSATMLREIAAPGKNTIITAPHALWSAYQALRENVEFVTRLGEASLEYRAQLKKGTPEAEAFLRGLYEGGRITLNFTRSGYTAKQINRYVPFFKIPFEAAYRVGEAVSEHPGRFLVKAILPSTALALMTVLLNQDDERYAEAYEFERDKYIFIPFKKAMVRIPKPNGVYGMIFNLAERSFRQWLLDDPAAFKDFAESAAGELLPRVSNPALELMVAASTGYSMQDERPIVPERQADLSPSRQVDSSTSPTVKALTPPSMSPKVAQYAIKRLIPGYSEGFFMVEDWIRRAVDDSQPALRVEDMPVVGRFVSRPGEGKQGRSVQLFYDQKDRIDQIYADLRDKIAKESAQPVTMDKLTPEQAEVVKRLMTEMSPEERKLLAARTMVNKTAGFLSELRRIVQAVENSKSMSPEAKRRALERINGLLTTTAKKALLAK